MPNVLKLPQNKKGRVFVISDIHGCFDIVDQALEELRLNETLDTVICVGDLIDRGPQSGRCLEFLGRPYVNSVLGNHEDAFLYFYGKHGEAILSPDFAWAGKQSLPNGLDWVQNHDKKFLEKMNSAFSALPIAIQVKTSLGTVGIVHADIPHRYDWKNFLRHLTKNNRGVIHDALFNREREKILSPWAQERAPELLAEAFSRASMAKGIDRVFFGHTIQPCGPRQLGNCFFIDTGAYNHAKNPDRYLTIADITADASAFAAPKSDSKPYRLIL